MHNSKKKDLIILERKKGKSIEKLSAEFSVPKGTVYSWVKDLDLPILAQKMLNEGRTLGKAKGIATMKNQRLDSMKELTTRCEKEVHDVKLTSQIKKILCSFLFWAEGAKALNSMNFINSDPNMIQMYLSLLRSSFSLDEKKLRALVHIHEYHNEQEVLLYWSKLTGIPLEQFNRSYLKKNTGKSKKDGYMGCISIRYYDYKIAQELFSVYNALSKQLGP